MGKQLKKLTAVNIFTSSRGPHVCPGTWLCDSPSLCADGTNILLLVATPVRTNQRHAMQTVIYSWNPYPQSCDSHPESIEFPGIHPYFRHYGTRTQVGPGWTTTRVLTSLVEMALAVTSLPTGLGISFHFLICFTFLHCMFLSTIYKAFHT